MAYRNFSHGNNGIIKPIADEIDYATKHDKKVEVGVETQKLDLAYLTFYNKGRESMMKTLEEVSTYYQNAPGFNGFAVHKFESWADLNK